MLVGALAAALILGVVSWKYQRTVQNEFYRVTTVTALGAERERSLKPHETFQECSDCPKMIVVPAGAFKMGSPDSDHVKGESPQHDVTIAQQLAVGIYEVTFREWDACATHGDCNPNIRAGGWGRLNQPAINVSWNDAQTYVAWLSRITGKTYRLLTEAQWEYAARATKPTYYSFGNDDGMLEQYAWYSANSQAQTHEVGQKKPNLFGLYDMHGNVSEWVEDCHRDGYQGAPIVGGQLHSKGGSRRFVAVRRQAAAIGKPRLGATRHRQRRYRLSRRAGACTLKGLLPRRVDVDQGPTFIATIGIERVWPGVPWHNGHAGSAGSVELSRALWFALHRFCTRFEE
jgi:formylglycine-generating enzyme required for sulfatase activity